MTGGIESVESARWFGERGDKWDANIDRFEPGIREVGLAAVEAAKLEAGERVLDIGCGGGLTTQWLAERVAPTGTAIGVDVSPRLVGTATRRAREARCENIAFVCTDAAALELDAPVDCLFSRFGVMFFDDPDAAFSHLRGLLTPSGRLLMACWGPPPENPWASELLNVVRRHVDVPRPDPHQAGPFAFADTDYVAGILDRAGFADVEFTPWRGMQLVGGHGATAESAAAFVIDTVSIGDLLADQPDAIRTLVERELVETMRPCASAEGIRMGAMAWLVSARAA